MQVFAGHQVYVKALVKQSQPRMRLLECWACISTSRQVCHLSSLHHSQCCLLFLDQLLCQETSTNCRARRYADSYPSDDAWGKRKCSCCQASQSICSRNRDKVQGYKLFHTARRRQCRCDADRLRGRCHDVTCRTMISHA